MGIRSPQDTDTTVVTSKSDDTHLNSSRVIPFVTHQTAKVKGPARRVKPSTVGGGASVLTPPGPRARALGSGTRRRPPCPRRPDPRRRASTPGTLVPFAPPVGKQAAPLAQNQGRRVLFFPATPGARSRAQVGRLDRALEWCQRFDTTGVWGPEHPNCRCTLDL